MATAKKKVEEEKEEKVEEVIPTESELILDQLTQNGFILVQWIGSTMIGKVAPSPNQAIVPFGAMNYGLVYPKQYMMIQKKDFDKRFYRRPTAKQKPDKSKVRVSVSGKVGQIIRVTW